jgi:hypothetical protein
MNYRYNVTVSVAIETNKANAGSKEATASLRSIEREAIESSRWINSERTKLEQQSANDTSKYSRQNYDNKVSDFKNQQELTRQNAAFEREQEIRKNQLLAQDNRNYHQNRFKEMQAASQREEALQKQAVNNALEYEKLGHQRIREQRQQASQLNAQILANDPFQNLGNRSRSLSQVNSSLQANEINQATARNANRNRITSDFANENINKNLANIDKVLNGQKIVDADRNLKNLTKTTKEATAQSSLFGQAFKGAFVGAIAGIAFSTLVSAITKPIELLGSLVQSAVEVGAEFEKTRNSIAVFAGSASLASKELAVLDETALNTTGLKLESAEQGYRSLRALGFQAEESRKLIQGLAKEQLLSGADETSVQRVIVNLTQLSAGSSRASQDIREIIHAMPSLRKEFKEAFGTLDSKKIGALFGENPTEAIAKLTAQLEKAKQAQGGLSAASVDFNNQWTVAGRDFSNEIIPELTRGLRDITGLIKENKQAFVELGRATADGLGQAIDGVKTLYKDAQGIAAIINGLSASGTSQEKQDRLNFVTPLRYVAKSDLNTPENKAAKEANRQLEIAQRQADEYAELSIKKLDAEQTEFDFMEKARKDALDFTNEYFQKESALSADYYSIEQAKLKSHLDLTLAEQRDTILKVGESKKAQLEREKGIQLQLFSAEVGLVEGDKKEIEKIQTKYNKIFSGLDKDLAINEINTKAELARKEQEILNQRRQNLLEFKSLQIREVNQTFDIQINAIQRGVDRETIEYNKGYDDIIDATNRKFNIVSQLTKDEFDLKLKQQGLTDQEILNLTKDRDLALVDLAEETNAKLLELNDKRFDETAKRLEFENQKIQSSLNARRELFSSINSIFDSTIHFGEGLKAGNIRNAFGEKGASDIFGNLQSVLGGTKTLYEAQNDLLKKQHEIQNEGLQREIRLQSDLLRIEQVRELGAKRLQAATAQNLISQYSQATTNILNSDNPNRDIIANDYRAKQQTAQGNLDAANTDIAKLEEAIKKDEIVISNEKTKQLDANLANLKAQEKQLNINHDLEDSQLNQNSNYEYLIGLFDKINSGNKDNLIAQITNIDLLQERNSAIYEDKKTQLTLENDTLRNLYLQTAAITHITELRKQELDAVVRIQNSQIDVGRQLTYSKNRADANLAEFFASQKGITEILSDARINTLTAAYDGLDKVAASLGKHFGFAKDMVTQLISGLLRLAANQIFTKLFGFSPFGGNSGNGGNGSSGRGIFGGGNVFGGGNQGGGIFSFGGGNGGSSNGGNQQNAFAALAQALGVPNNPNAFGGYLPGRPQTGDTITLPDGTLATQVNAGSSSSAGGGIRSQLQGILPLLGASLGTSIGGGRGLGGALGGIGGGLLGLVGGAFGSSSTAFGGLFGSIGGALGISGAATLGIGAAIGGGILLASFLIGRNSRRRKEEKQRNQATLDAFAGIDKLIEQVNNDKIDGNQALEQADSIRKQYVDTVSQFKDKKTRNIALADVSRIDAKIQTLKTAVASQTARRQRLELFAPTFADGGSLSNFANNNFRNNPLGYQRGKGTGRSDSMLGYFPKANSYARFSNTEYILDAETTRNLGVDKLDLIRQTKGQALNSMLFRWDGFEKRADGGAIVTQTAQPSSSVGTSGTPEIHLHIDGSMLSEAIANAISFVIKSNDGSSQQINAIASTLENQGQSKLTNQLAEQILAKIQR